MRKGAQVEVISIKIIRAFSPRSLYFGSLQAWFDHANYAFGDLILEVENVFDRTIEPVGPEMHSGLSFDQLCSDPQALARAKTDTALQDITHSQFAAQSAKSTALPL